MPTVASNAKMPPAMANVADVALPKTRHRASRRAIAGRHEPGTCCFALTTENRTSWRFWPDALARIVRFAERYPCDMDTGAFCQMLTVHFAAGVPLSRIWLVVSPDDHPIGHLVASIERRGRDAFAHVWQFELDAPLPSRVRRAVWHDLSDWAAAQGAQYLELWTAHDPELWTRTYGFVPYRTIMRRSLP